MFYDTCKVSLETSQDAVNTGYFQGGIPGRRQPEEDTCFAF